MQIEDQVVELLIRQGRSITTAESCTGGLLSGRIVNVAGASEVLNEAHVTYANEAKEKILGVRHETLEHYGAVSFQTAEEMAAGAARIACADVALATTGIAGPGGGSKEKPVGLVYIGCYMNEKVYSEECHFQGSRGEVRNAAVERALHLLLEKLKER